MEGIEIIGEAADGEEALKEQFYANTGKGTRAGPPVDSVGILADGTRLEDVTDLVRLPVYEISNSLVRSELLEEYPSRNLTLFGSSAKTRKRFAVA